MTIAISINYSKMKGVGIKESPDINCAGTRMCDIDLEAIPIAK